MTSRASLLRDAVRPALKARLMLAGPPGSGKTRTGLIIATSLSGGDKFAVIDTERESALTYADDFDFKHLPWLPPYDPRELADTITELGRDWPAVMVDSTSHFWRKAGGTLDIADGKFGGWKAARPAQEDLVDAVLACGAHVILCTRSKMTHAQEEDPKTGKQKVVKLGMAPQQDDDLEYELNIAAELDMEHRLTISKSRCIAVPVGRFFAAGHAQEMAELYGDWLELGEPAASQATVDALVKRMNDLPDELRKACKGEFVSAIARPDHLRESQLGDAEALVSRFEAQVSADRPGTDSPTGEPLDGLAVGESDQPGLEPDGGEGDLPGDPPSAPAWRTLMDATAGVGPKTVEGFVTGWCHDHDREPVGLDDLHHPGNSDLHQSVCAWLEGQQ